jgi:hypothetical protein
LVWSRELGTTRGLEATPLAENGILYIRVPRPEFLMIEEKYSDACLPARSVTFNWPIFTKVNTMPSIVFSAVR